MSKIARQTFSGIILVALILALMMSRAHASQATKEFIQSATIGNQFEISSSRLALQNSHNDDVKQFAQQMIDDHTQAANDMKTALAKKGTVPRLPAPALDLEHQKIVDELNNLSGSDFDKQYVKMQVAAHNQAISLFRNYSKNGDDPLLKSYAAQTLPTLKEHQKRIDKIGKSI